MPGRTAALVATLALIALLGYLTLNVLIREGFDILVATSLVILAMFSLRRGGRPDQPARGMSGPLRGAGGAGGSCPRSWCCSSWPCRWPPRPGSTCG